MRNDKGGSQKADEQNAPGYDASGKKPAEESIRRQILADPVWKEVRGFYPFVSYGTEVDTTGLIREVLAHPVQGRRINVAVPRSTGRIWSFIRSVPWRSCVPVIRAFGTGTALSAGRSERRSDASARGLLLTWKGHRVGYGGGYYDRYLAKYRTEKLHRYAVAYDFQIVDNIESEAHDIAPDRIITSQNKHN